MKTLNEVAMNPTSFDSRANYAGEIPDDCWLVCLGRNRDSDLLTESNWTVALKKLGGESDDVQVFRFGHWACGWIEYLCVKQGSKAQVIAENITKKIDAYPVLDENHFTELENDEANRVWAECYDKKDRVKYIRRFRNQFDFQSWSDLMSVVRGEYFNGYASELIN